MQQQKNGENPTQVELAAEYSGAAVIPEDYQLNLSDFALFLSVMKVKEAYADVLSIIMDESELRLKEVKVEQVVLNKSGKRAIRLDAWALDWENRQFNMEMQNDTSGDDVRKRSRFYQSMIDTPVLKAGKETRYRNLPSTVIIFITRDDIFGKNLAMYTFSERCEEVPDLPLEDGTTKIFVNMASLNGRPDLVSLLQYMKHTTLDNPDILVKDERILELDRIVSEVKQSEEWEAVKMNILEIGLQQGIERGMAQGMAQGIEQGMARGIQGMVETCQEVGISQSETLRRLMEKLSLSEDTAREQLEKYWR
ncbi:MAG: Rpn family recombination-promoting nuclease/putative transposase [Acetatifactor sp.]|nr:Rpn family recombination-promoting nuclease/putative transposase [Acetatifactor sp.]